MALQRSRIKVGPKRELPTASTKEGREQRGKLFMEAAPTVLAAHELDWLPPGYVSPGVRLEYLRLLNGLEAGDWAQQADVPVNALGNWRGERAMPDGFGDAGKTTRLYLGRLLGRLKQSAELAWVLAGSGPTTMTPTLADRVEIALGVLEGLKNEDPLFKEDACKKIGIEKFAAFEPAAKPEDRDAAIQKVAMHCKPWCSEEWLRKGVASPPAAISKLAKQMKTMTPQHPKWTVYNQQKVTLQMEMTRAQAVELAAVVNAMTGVDVGIQKLLLDGLDRCSSIGGLTLGALTTSPISVEEFLMMVSALRRGLVRVVRGGIRRQASPEAIPVTAKRPSKK